MAARGGGPVAAPATTVAPARRDGDQAVRGDLADPATLSPLELTRLQRMAGNAAVVGLLGGGAATAQRSIWDDVTGAASNVLGEVESAGASLVGGVASAGASLVGDSEDSLAWTAFQAVASTALGGADASFLAGAKALGAGALRWLAGAGSAIWGAISWFGSKAWSIIVAIGTDLFEKVVFLGTLAWSLLTNLPIRLWRLVVDGWDALVGVVSWLWTGLAGAVGELWDAIVGAFTWLGQGQAGVLRWLFDGLAGGVDWLVAFVQAPSGDALLRGLLGTLTWVWDGMGDLVRWGWNGLAAAAKWAVAASAAFSRWLWDGAIAGLAWVGEVLLHLLEVLGVGELLELIWGLLFHLRPLDSSEESASLFVHPAGLIPYGLVRVDDNSYLIKIGTALAALFRTKVTPGAITTMHIVHAPAGGLSVPVAVHELTHVAQYELVGAIYMPEALHAQGSTAGYDYGDLTAARSAGKTYADFNREQQASICEDYYRVTHGLPAEYGGTRPELDPFIADMRARKF